MDLCFILILTQGQNFENKASPQEHLNYPFIAQEVLPTITVIVGAYLPM